MKNAPMQGKILVTFALFQEGYPFARRLTQRTRKDGVVFGRFGAVEIAVCQLGIGVKSRDRFARIISEIRPRLVISSGFAGGVLSLLRTGDFVLSTNFSSPDLAEHFSRSFSASGRFVNVTQVATPETKSRLGLEGDVLAVDMESEQVAQICQEASVSVLTARMISDRSDESIPRIFIGQKARGLHDILDAVRFAGRMLILREKLATRLGRLVERVVSDQ
jgi:nucleoside phosphorylase